MTEELISDLELIIYMLMMEFEQNKTRSDPSYFFILWYNVVTCN